MVTAYFLAEKQGNRKDLAIGLTVKNSYTLPCKKNLRMGATLWGIEVYGPDRSFGSIGILDRIRAQITGHPAGIRINVLISMGACLFLMFPLMSGSDEVYRIASYIVSGVGFLCSGVIFKEGGTVRGLNTAATLWCTAAVGVLSSSGSCLFAVAAAVILILSNLLFRPLAVKIKPITCGEETERTYRISVTCQENAETEIRALLINSNSCKTLYLTNLESSDVIGGKVEIQADFLSVGKAKAQMAEAIVNRLLTLSSVVSAGWELV